MDYGANSKTIFKADQTIYEHQNLEVEVVNMDHLHQNIISVNIDILACKLSMPRKQILTYKNVHQRRTLIMKNTIT